MLFIILSSLLFISSLYSSQPTLQSLNEEMFNILRKAEKVELKDIDDLLNQGAQIDTRDFQGKTFLDHAVLRGDNNLVKYFLGKGAEMGMAGKMTPLHLAARQGHLETVKLLVEQYKVPINVLTWCSNSPLHSAANSENENLEVVKYLLDNGAELEGKNRFDNTPLHFAVLRGHTNIVECFIKKGANINAVNKNGCTPLKCAIEGEFLEIAEFLRQNEAQIEINSEEEEEVQDLSDLVEYEEERDLEQTNLLLDAVKGEEIISPEQIEEYVNAGAALNATGEFGKTLLHYAAEKGHVNAVKFIIKKGAIVDARAERNETPLHFAAYENRVEIVEYLLKSGADINAVDNERRTPLHVAVIGNALETARLLLQKGALVNEEDYCNSATPLHYAAHEKRFEIVKYLLENGANIKAVDKYGSTPLHVAAAHGHFDIVELLLENGANIKAVDKYGSTPLHVAATHDHLDVVELLLENGANIKAVDKYGSTPLHVAAAHGHLAIVELLLENGAQVDAKNKEAETPFDLAKDENIKKILQQTSSLFAAVKKGSITQQEIDDFVKNGAILNATDKEGNTILHYAMQSNNQELINYFSKQNVGKESPLNGDKKTKKKEDPTPKFPGSLGAQSSYISAGMKVGGVCLLASSLIYGQYESKNRIEQKQVENQSFMKKFLLFLKSKKLSATLGIVGTGLVTASFFVK